MKSLFFTLMLCSVAIPSFSQQEYLLQPADTPGTVTITEPPLMARIRGQMAKVNRINRFDGYRIEVYNKNSRTEARDILLEVNEKYPGVPAEIVFEGAFVKVKVGIFRSKLEAHALWCALEKTYPGAKIVFGKGLPYPPLPLIGPAATPEGE